MSPVLASAIVIVDDGIIIDAEVLAPKLGLSAEALKGEMRKGIVYSVAETGVDEDAGRIRLTFRYRTRAGPWWSSPTARWSRAPHPPPKHRRRTPIA
jgi:hypothetical protein